MLPDSDPSAPAPPGHEHVTVKPVINLAEHFTSDRSEIPAGIAERLHLDNLGKPTRHRTTRHGQPPLERRLAAHAAA